MWNSTLPVDERLKGMLSPKWICDILAKRGIGIFDECMCRYGVYERCPTTTTSTTTTTTTTTAAPFYGVDDDVDDFDWDPSNPFVFSILFVLAMTFLACFYKCSKVCAASESRSAAMRGAESDPEGGLTTPEAPLHSDAPPPYSSVQLDAPPPYEKICKLGEPQQKPASSSCDV